MAAGVPVEGTATGAMAADVARPDVPTCLLDEPVDVVRQRVETSGWDACVVVNADRVVLGLLRQDELATAEDEPVEQVMRPGPRTFRPHVPIGTLAHYMLDHELFISLITTSDGRLVGLLRQQDALRAAHGDHDHLHAERAI